MQGQMAEKCSRECQQIRQMLGHQSRQDARTQRRKLLYRKREVVKEIAGVGIARFNLVPKGRDAASLEVARN